MDFAEVLRLEAERPASHLDAVGADKKVRDVRQQDAAEHFEVPCFGDDEVQVVVRVVVARVEHGMRR